MGLQHSEASRNAVCTSGALPPNKTHSHGPARRLSPLLCRTSPSTGLPGALVSPQGPLEWTTPARQHHLHPLQESLSGETGLGARRQREGPLLPESADVHGASHKEGLLLLGLRQGLPLAGALSLGTGVTASVLKRQLRLMGEEGVIGRDKPPTQGGAAR